MSFTAILAGLAALAGPGVGIRAAVAMDICGETVPTNRFIDGIPAYAQCTGSMNGAVYSNDGVNTATASGGTGWLRTQSSGGYQCTELAHRYLAFRWNVTSVPNGNAGVWCDATLPAGIQKAAAPVHGDLIVFAPGSCGADATTGHVAIVDVVNADGSVNAVQQNGASRSKYAASCAACFLHVSANDGTPADGGAGGQPDGSMPDGSAGASGAAGRGGSTGAAGHGGGAGTGAGGTGTAGSTGAAGTSGTAGSTGGAGTSGTAGSTGTGGTSGAAGTSVDAGSGGTGGPDESTAAPGGGCGCHTADRPRTGSASGALGLLALAFALILRRRPPAARRFGKRRRREECSRSSRP